MAVKTKIQIILNNLATRNERIFRVVLQDWMFVAIKQIQQDLTSKFKKDVTSKLTDWTFIEDQGKKILKPATLKIMQTGGNQAYKQLAVAGSFDVLNVRAIKAADKFCAKLVTDVTANTKKGVRTYISAGVKAGKSMPKIARELRPLVGLTKPQTQSIINYRRLLGEKHPELSAAQVDKRVMTYTNKTHRQRMENIARTETARAQNIGYVQGLEEIGVAEVELINGPNPCDECITLNKTRFPVSEAAEIIPVHPRCTCGMLPVIDDEAISETLMSAPPELPGAMASEEGLLPWKQYLNTHTGEKSTNGLLYDWYKLRYETSGKITEGTKKFLRAKASKFEATSIKISKPIPGLEDIIKPIKVPLGPKPVSISVPKPKPVTVKPKPTVSEGMTQKQWEVSLTEDQKYAIKIYTDSYESMEVIKDYQLGKKVSAWGKKIGQDFEAAMKTAPKFEGMLYRGMGILDDTKISSYKKGNTITFKTTTSASRTHSVAVEFSGYADDMDNIPVQMMIKSKTGVRIGNLSDYIDQKEVVLRKGSKFRVMKEPEWVADASYRSKGYYRIHLEEIVAKPKPVLTTKFSTAEDYRQALLDLAAGKTSAADAKKLQQLITKRKAVSRKTIDLQATWRDSLKTVSEAERKVMYHAYSESREKVWRIQAQEAAIVKRNKVSLQEMRAMLSEETNMSGSLKAYQTGKWQSTADDILGWLPKKALTVDERNAIKYFSTETGRKSGSLMGSYTRSRHTVNMFVSNKKVFAHEFGHHLSYQIKGAYKKQIAFFRARTAGEINKKLPGFTDIVGKKDKFNKYSYYAGRVYEDGTIPECISVGLEYIWKNPVAAAKKDPEWFRMVISALKKL